MAIGKVMGAVLCCVAFGAHAAAAARFGPAKPSQVVVLTAGGSGDPCSAGGGQGFVTQLNADDTRAPFQIPAGQVLIVTEVTVRIFDSTVTSPSNRIFLIGFPTGLGPLDPVAFFVVPLDASGFGANAQELSPGVVFASGHTVCIGSGGGGVYEATLVGYLTKDK